MGTMARELEKKGIPTFSIIYHEHVGTFMQSPLLAGLGPVRYFDMHADSIQTAEGAVKVAKEAFPELIKGLTVTSEPEYMKLEGNTLVPYPASFSFVADNMDAAEAAFAKKYLEMSWTDGLPVVAPTKEKVEWMLTGTDLPRDHVVGKMGPSLGLVTVENIAINAVMAGARPEYMPVIIAAMEAITSYNFDWYNAQLRGVWPLIWVNGPISRDIGINYRENTLGPNPEMPASGPISRAVNFIWRNAGGYGIGLYPPGQHGQAGQFAGMVIAESEWDEYGWKPYNQKLGFPAGTNTVSVIGVMGGQNIAGHDAGVVGPAVTPTNAMWPNDESKWKSRKAGVIIVQPLTAGNLWNHYGLSKDDFAQQVADGATVTKKEFLGTLEIKDESTLTGLRKTLVEKYGDEIPIAPSGDNFIVINSGGWCVCMPFIYLPTDNWMSSPVTKMIKLPGNWSALLEAAK